MNEKILIVEDEKKISHLLSINFMGENYIVETAFSGEEALKKIDKFNPDLVLLDVMLPNMSGWDVCRKIKQNQKHSKTLVIILTASSQKSDIEKAVMAGADGFYIKPFEIEVITKEIAEMFRERESGKK